MQIVDSRIYFFWLHCTALDWDLIYPLVLVSAAPLSSVAPAVQNNMDSEKADNGILVPQLVPSGGGGGSLIWKN